MNYEKQWYAVYTRPRWEKKVSDLLNKRNVENFCPLNKVVRQWADRKKTIYEPLFTSYVFVCASEIDQLTIRKTDGILNFVYWLGKPAVIKNDEINAIKTFLEKHHDIRLEKINVNVSDKVRITDGPLIHLEGDVLEVKNKSVKVFLPSLGYAMIAEISKARIELVNNIGNSILTSNQIYNGNLS